MVKHYSSEYKEYVAKMVVEDGRKATDFAFELDLHYSSVNRWVNQYRQKIDAANAPKEYITSSELEALKKQHEKQMKELQEENEILKKAMHIFSKRHM
ncbi:transposase [Rossellomorea marisflavi]|uniref:transposase n=1 Tax=Rossellomorea marisflavi TaxID=189381 RepID=UPI00064E76A8|nr:transposase [Rossellomorea marisflavi]KML33579.1 transposase [Rossellomorea marisflavi]